MGDILIDAHTKQVLAHVVSESLEGDFVLETVNMLIRDHGISLHHETIVHSDQGVHYTRCKFVQIKRYKSPAIYVPAWQLLG